MPLPSDKDNIRYHQVRYGDTLTSISTAYYGSPDYAMAIYQHNKHYVANPNQLHPGQKLSLPVVGILQRIIDGLI